MKKSLIVIGFSVFVVCQGGCVSVESDQGGDHKKASVDGAIAEIDAVGKLSFSSEREAGYERIAGRKGLSPRAQAYLVDEALDKLSFDSEKEEVLLALIGNSSFSSAAEREILQVGIERLAFESSKKRVLKAINDRK